MSYVDIWIHGVWGTKYRQPVLEKTKRKNICEHIRENAREKGIFIDTIDGHLDHLHFLGTLHADMPISKLMQLLKGESSFWINRNRVINNFTWADEYCALSVSKNQIDTVRAYILNQEEHHKKITFSQEYDKLMKELGFRHG